MSMVEVPLCGPDVVDNHLENPGPDQTGGARDDLEPDHQAEEGALLPGRAPTTWRQVARLEAMGRMWRSAATSTAVMPHPS